MEKNFTPVDVALVKKKYSEKEIARKSFDINSIFLVLIVLTLIVLSILLFILIQKEMKELALIGFFA